MSKHQGIFLVLIITICMSITACSYSAGGKLETNSAQTDSLVAHKDILTQIYIQAISEFIKADFKNNKTTFDTLYFGKHVYGQDDDFPDIKLPVIIENTHLRLVSPEIGQKMQAERKSLVYVNMMGWVNKEQAEFIVVVFKNGGEHQYDYFLNFKYNSLSNKFVLNQVAFENYLNLKGQKPKRTLIF